MNVNTLFKFVEVIKRHLKSQVLHKCISFFEDRPVSPEPVRHGDIIRLEHKE